MSGTCFVSGYGFAIFNPRRKNRFEVSVASLVQSEWTDFDVMRNEN